MRKLFIKSTLYIVFIIITLEVIVRFFHLYPDVPIRYIDEFGVEKSIPNQTGYAVTGNRNQNYSEYRINNFGFNSFREFTPTEDNIEVALIGDSFIEGFHQDYYDSTGKKIENKLKNIEVYEYGYGGYDLANQLHLINAYKTHFEKIDHIIIYLKYENDLKRDFYAPNHERIALLKSPLFVLKNNFKLLNYTSTIGIVDPIKKKILDIISKKKESKNKNTSEIVNEDLVSLEIFKTLINTFGFNKNKTAFLLNRNTTSPVFLDYCDKNRFEIIDYGHVFKASKQVPTLIYDKHWNNHGRDLISLEIVNFLKHKLN